MSGSSRADDVRRQPPEEPGTRRHFLGRSGAAALLLGVARTAPLGALYGAGCASPGGGRFSGRIDTHTHFYDPTRPEGVPWPGREDTFLYRPVLPGEFERVARPQGVTATVVVEASARVEDNAWVLGLADRHPALIGLVGRLHPGTPGFAADLLRFAADRRFRGIRLGGGEVARLSGDPTGLRDLGRLSDRGLVVDVLIGPGELGSVAALARAVPGLRIVIDHCANVSVDGATPPRAWLQGLEACGGIPSIAMKVSGLVEGTGRTDGRVPTDPGYYAPVVDAVWGAFGSERVMFGSNWPVSSRFASYATVVGIAEAHAVARGAEATARFFRDNALRLYGLGRV